MDKLTLEVKALAVDELGAVSGIAWPYGHGPDRVGDEITKGAFSTPARVPMLYGHDPLQPVGVWDSVLETDAGLEVKGRLLVDQVERAREVRALVREGAVTGLSIGFVTRKAAPRRGGGRTISALDLQEISIVPIPSHPAARIITAKSATQEGRMAEHDNGAAADLASIETKIDAVASEVKSFNVIRNRLDQLEAKMNRPAGALLSADNDNAGFERKAFSTFARFGEGRLSADEVKALTVANNDALAPAEFAAEMLKSLVQFSPIRAYAKVVTIGAAEIKYPRRTGLTNATWTGETADRTTSEPTFDQVTLTPYELATFTDISNALLEDNFYALESELAATFGEDFGVKEGAAFVGGNGTTRPKGLLVASGIAEVTTGLASGFPAANPADVLIGVFHSLPAAHAQNGTWLMNRNTLATIRKFKDAQGRYLVLDGLADGAPVTLLGRPIVEAIDMADVAANAYPIMFGDLAGYRIVDRVSLSVLRDPFTMATKGQVRFHARKRVGADVTNPDRFVKLKVAA
jgi:HK97 family phage major capsid protein/HK97 family phage prohead protease